MSRLRSVHLAWGFLGLLVFLSLFADFLSSNPPSRQNLEQFYHPPSRIHFFDGEGRFGLRPFIYPMELKDLLDVSYRENTQKAYPLEFFYKGYRYSILGLVSSDRHLVGRSRGPRYFPLGTDELGRDVLARVLAGTRTSLLVVVSGVLLYAALGLSIGAFAGYCGGWVDSALMRVSEFVLALPALYLVLALRALLPLQMEFLMPCCGLSAPSQRLPGRLWPAGSGDWCCSSKMHLTSRRRAHWAGRRRIFFCATCCRHCFPSRLRNWLSQRPFFFWEKWSFPS
jgi:peptide/nickel transport system permease protein